MESTLSTAPESFLQSLLFFIFFARFCIPITHALNQCTCSASAMQPRKRYFRGKPSAEKVTCV